MVTATSVSEASGKAQQSGELANLAMEKMRQVFEKMANSQEMVFKFGEKTKQIGKIVEMITNIARQTNLLALNATIEAARAGEYGKGFAVVADEVRKLAESTSTAAEQITDLVSEIEHESERVVSSMKETAQNIAEGREDLGTISLSLEEIVQMVTTAADKVRNISDLAQIQAEGAKELVRSIDEIAKVAHENATSIEQVSTVTPGADRGHGRHEPRHPGAFPDRGPAQAAGEQIPARYRAAGCGDRAAAHTRSARGAGVGAGQDGAGEKRGEEAHPGQDRQG